MVNSAVKERKTLWTLTYLDHSGPSRLLSSRLACDFLPCRPGNLSSGNSKTSPATNDRNPSGVAELEVGSKEGQDGLLLGLRNSTFSAVPGTKKGVPMAEVNRGLRECGIRVCKRREHGLESIDLTTAESPLSHVRIWRDVLLDLASDVADIVLKGPLTVERARTDTEDFGDGVSESVQAGTYKVQTICTALIVKLFILRNIFDN